MNRKQRARKWLEEKSLDAKRKKYDDIYPGKNSMVISEKKYVFPDLGTSPYDEIVARARVTMDLKGTYRQANYNFTRVDIAKPTEPVDKK